MWVWCGFPNGYRKDIFSKKIGRRAQNLLTILGSRISVIGADLYDRLLSMRMFAFDNEQDIHMSSEHYEESVYGLDLKLLTIFYELHVSHPRRSE